MTVPSPLILLHTLLPHFWKKLLISPKDSAPVFCCPLPEAESSPVSGLLKAPARSHAPSHTPFPLENPVPIQPYTINGTSDGAPSNRKSPFLSMPVPPLPAGKPQYNQTRAVADSLPEPEPPGNAPPTRPICLHQSDLLRLLYRFP